MTNRATLGQPLTAREAQIVRYSSIEGRTNLAISQALCITEDEVRSHLGKAYRKLGARGRDHAAQLLATASTTGALQ